MEEIKVILTYTGQEFTYIKSRWVNEKLRVIDFRDNEGNVGTVNIDLFNTTSGVPLKEHLEKLSSEVSEITA
jgi:hypothetical protein